MRVVIVAAYASVRAGLRTLLDGAAGLEVVAEGAGSADLERLWPEARPDVVLADDLPGDRTRLLETAASGGAALVLLGESRDGFHALADAPLAGWAYLLKDADGTEIAGAIFAASAGLAVLDRGLLAGTVSPAHAETAGAPGEALTARERDVLALMARGLPNKQIAARLEISLHTVKFHVASILGKLGASSRTEAVTVGVRRGAVSL